jgi:mannose-1-phosphate guanylyltransferase
MKAVLLVAGLGTRLRPLTDKTPKCLLPIGGKPLLQIWLEKLAAADVNEVLINTHWLPDKVESFLNREIPKTELTIKTYHEPKLLGSAGTLAANKDWFDDKAPFFIIYGDNLTWVDLSKMKSFHQNHGLSVTLGVFRTPHPERCGIAETDQNGIVEAFVEKPQKPKSNLAAAGIYVADYSLFEAFPTTQASFEDTLDLGFDIFPKMIGRMKCFEIDEVIDIGTPEAYELAQRAWQDHKEKVK